jgi:hypothetical protein
MTRCKVADIAMIVGLPRAIQDAADRFVQCVEACEIAGQPGWVLDRRIECVTTRPVTSISSGHSFGVGASVYFDRIQDKYLRPIRGDLTADDVADEVPADAERVS